jgi:hypothetical protein
MSVRAKFAVVGIEKTKYGQDVMQTIKLNPVSSGSEENKMFWRYSPSGRIELGTVNAEAAAEFELGGEYYIDFSKAPTAAP